MSYGATVGKAPAMDGLAVDQTLALFAEDRGAARRAFARFVAQGVGVAPPVARQQMFVGDEAFAEQMASKAHKVSSEVPRRQRAVKSLAAYARDTADRNEAIAVAYASGGYTLKAIGEHFGMHYATVSRIARSHTRRNKT